MKNHLSLANKPKYNIALLFVVAAVLVLFGIFVIFKSHAATNNADFNNDGTVGIQDLSILASHYNQTGQTQATGDANGDGSVNISDLSILASQWGTGSGGTQVYGYRGTPGIPAGTTLTTYTGPNPITVSGTVLDGVYVAGGLTINADNVTVRNSHIDGPGGDQSTAILVQGKNTTISHNLIGNSNNVLSGHFAVTLSSGAGGNTQIIGNDMWHIHGGVYLWNDSATPSDSVLVQDNWVHQMNAQAGDHMNNITSECSYNVTVDHNRFEGAVAAGSQADTAFTMSIYSDDQGGCPVTKNSPYTTVQNGQTVHIGGLQNLVFTNNYGDVHGSYGLWFNDVIGTITIANNMESNSGFGLWASPDFVTWDGYGNVNTNSSLYPIGAGQINTRVAP